MSCRDLTGARLAMGRGPERQWLVYAQAPLGPRTGVEVTVPDFGPVKIDAPPAGAFYLVDEKTKNVAAVGAPAPSEPARGGSPDRPR